MAYIDDVYLVVNIAPVGIPTYVRLSQNENGRRLYFAVAGGEIPSGSTATMSGTKPDGVVYSKAGTVSGNTVTFNEDIQLTAVAGEWPAKIVIVNGGQTIMTARIRVVIDADTVAAGAVPSDSQLEGLVAQAAAYAEAAKDGAFYGSPLVASTVAEMTDQTRVYVYTGSESGYTSGNWYYWDGSAWTSGGVYNATAVSTDTTLSIAGKAADAKATGDAIAAVTIPTDKTLTQSDEPADAKVVGDEIADLKDDLEEISEGDIEYDYVPLSYVPVSIDRTRQGIHFVQGTDGTVQASGTNDGTGASFWGMQDAEGVHFFSLSASKTYRLTGCPSGGSQDKYDINIRKSTGGTLFADEGNGCIFTPPDDDLYQIVVTVRKDYAISGTLTFSPLLEERIVVQSTMTAVDKIARETLEEISEVGTRYIYTPLTYDSIYFDRTRQGIRFIQKTDGTVDVSGTNDGTANSLLDLQDAEGTHFFSLSASKTYRLTGCAPGGSPDGYLLSIRKSTGGTLFADYGNGVIFTPPDDDNYKIVLAVQKNCAISGTLIFNPLLEERTEIQNDITAVDKYARKGLGLFNNTVVTPQMFGAVGDGTTDDSQAVADADSFNGASAVFFPPGVYNISDVTAHKSWIMADGAWITTTTANGTVITIAGDGHTYKLNCNFENINPYWAIDVTGDYNHIEQLIVEGMSYDGNTQPYGSAALMVHGNYNTVDFARFRNFVQSNEGNDSAPQCIATLDTATDNYFADIYSYNCRATFVNAAGVGTRNAIGTIRTINSHDNGVYCVRGGDMDIGIMEHDGSDEGFVVITDNYQLGLGLSNVYLGTFICKNCDVAIRIKNAGKVVIGTAIIYDCNIGIRLDLANAESESLTINSFNMIGKMMKPVYIAADGLRGKLDCLHIDKMYIDHDKAPTNAQSTDLNTYIEVSAVDELYIGDCNIDFSADDAVYGSGNIKMVLNSAPDKKSFVGKCKVVSTHDFELTPIGQELMFITNGLLNNGSAVVDDSGIYDSGLFASGAPQSGYWEKGQIINSTDTNVAEYRCVASGTPGTWKTVQLT